MAPQPRTLPESDALLSRALRLGADECELVRVERDVTTVRITDSRIAESKHVLGTEYGVRMVMRGRITSARAPDCATLDRMLEGCVSDASCDAMAPCAFWRGLASPQSAGKSDVLRDAYDPRLGDCMDGRVAEEIAERMIGAALSGPRQVTVTGSVNIVSETFEILNTNHISDSERATYATCIANAESGGRERGSGSGSGSGSSTAGDAHTIGAPPESMSGMGHSAARTLARLDPESAGMDALSMCLESENPVSVDDGKYTIVFAPYSAGELLAFVASPNFGLKRVRDGLSCLSGGAGGRRAVASEMVSIYDDPHAPDGIGSHRIDAEGLPTARRPLVERGVFVGTYSDLFDYYRTTATDAAAGSALDSGKPADSPSANAARMAVPLGRGADPIPVSAPHNLSLEAADRGAEMSVDEMIRDIRRGLLVGRLWYTYAVNPIRGDFSCTARSGIALVENGRIVSAARPVRIMHNLLMLLADVSGVGDDARSVVQWASLPSITPSLRVENVPVTRL